MVQARHERNQHLTVRRELVEGLVQGFLKNPTTLRREYYITKITMTAEPYFCSHFNKYLVRVQAALALKLLLGLTRFFLPVTV